MPWPALSYTANTSSAGQAPMPNSSTVITDGAVFQRDGIIEDVGAYDELRSRHQYDEDIGGRDYMVIPGLVNAHHHGRAGTGFQMCGCDDSLETWILAGWVRRPFDHYLVTPVHSHADD